MKRIAMTVSILGVCLFVGLPDVFPQNPIIRDQFTADPSARVFEGKIYVYPSHDVNCGTNWFCMKDYHVFSSENLMDWTDHGVIVAQNKVPWVDSTANSMWAPDCIEKKGKYYFYFPAISKDKSAGRRRGMRIGVAISDTPYGPFIPESEPIADVMGIDPNAFIDKDGQGYLFWGGGRRLSGAKLKNNLLELAFESQQIEGLPDGFKEGPYLFERNDVYYFTFPHVIQKTEALAYAMGDNPMGPFQYKGVIMDESPTGCWTNHHSILEYKGQWYLFYHHNDLSPDFDKNRSVRADSLFFNEDGTIRKVIPTLRGVGLANAGKKIQLDRYSAISQTGTSIAFLDTLNTFGGWKTILQEQDAWIKYNSVNFEKRKWKSVQVNASSETGSTIEICLDKMDGPVVAKVTIPQNTDWNVVNSELQKVPSGIHHLAVKCSDVKKVEIDWIRFE